MKWNETIMDAFDNIETNPLSILLGEEVATLIAEMLNNTVCDGYEVTSCVEHVEHRHVSGFVPFTSGGFTATGTYLLDGEAGWSLARIRPILDADEASKAEAFRDEFADAVEGDECEHAEWEAFNDSWNDEPPYFFTRADAAMWSEGVATFRFGVCNDLDYGRDSVGAWAGDSGTAWYYKCSVPVADITADMVKMIGEEMARAWNVAGKVAGRVGELSEYAMPATIEAARDQAIAHSNRVARIQSWQDVARDSAHFDAVCDAFPELREEFIENGIL